MSKKCNKCNKTQPKSNFQKKASNKDGLCNYCKTCKSKIDREYRERFKKTASIDNKKRCQKLKSIRGLRYRKKNPRKVLLTRAKSRAKVKDLDFNLSIDDIVIPKICPVLGIPIYTSTTGRQSSNSASIDRIDSSKGYTKDNISIISWRANSLKNDASLQEMKCIIAYMESAIKNEKNNDK